MNFYRLRIEGISVEFGTLKEIEDKIRKNKKNGQGWNSQNRLFEFLFELV